MGTDRHAHAHRHAEARHTHTHTRTHMTACKRVRRKHQKRLQEHRLVAQHRLLQRQNTFLQTLLVRLNADMMDAVAQLQRLRATRSNSLKSNQDSVSTTTTTTTTTNTNTNT